MPDEEKSGETGKSFVSGVQLRRRELGQEASKRNQDFNDNQYSSQFYDTCAPPVRSIIRAFVLLAIGVVLTVVGSLLLAGYFDVRYKDRTWPVLTIGLICFIPGFYYTRIAYYAHKGYPGYDYTDIPNDD